VVGYFLVDYFRLESSRIFRPLCGDVLHIETFRDCRHWKRSFCDTLRKEPPVAIETRHKGDLSRSEPLERLADKIMIQFAQNKLAMAIYRSKGIMVAGILNCRQLISVVGKGTEPYRRRSGKQFRRFVEA
jgi:hypothetical protein